MFYLIILILVLIIAVSELYKWNTMKRKYLELMNENIYLKEKLLKQN